MCVWVYVCRKYSYDQLNKNLICSPVCVCVCVCVHVGKVYWINVSIVNRIKEEKSLALLTYMYILFTQPLRSDRIWHKVNFLAEFNIFEFRVFLLLD